MTKFVTLILLTLLSSAQISGQSNSEILRNPDTENCAKAKKTCDQGQIVRVVFYNTENLFDPFNDSTKIDNEFTAAGKKRWSYGKFFNKLTHLAKTLIAIGAPEPPSIVGLCEVENRFVLKKLVHDTPLKNFHYLFIHHDSPDPRGIDVALLYRPERFRVIDWRTIEIRFPFDSNLKTRDILYVRGILFNRDTIHVFVNHWPSQLGGSFESEPKREIVARILRKSVDTIFSRYSFPNILILGDFNEEPDQPGIKIDLAAISPDETTHSNSLVDLMTDMQHDWNHGTHKYQGKWSVIDQMIISGVMMTGQSGLIISSKAARIFSEDFLMQEEKSFPGAKPYRTYNGPMYIGGFSDHLPVYLDIIEKK